MNNPTGVILISICFPFVSYANTFLVQIFDRESKRERILEARMREFRLKMRQAEEGSPIAVASEVDLTVGDKDLAEATTDYMQLVKKELAAM